MNDMNTPDVIIGQEFLTWLWYRSDTAPGSFTNAAGEPFSVAMDQRITVQGGEGDGLETASVSGTLSPLREARVGLTTGKKVSRAVITMEKDELSFSVSVKADDFSLNSLKTPKIDKTDSDDDPDALILEKISLIETATELFDSLFKTFISLRMDAQQWEEEVLRIHRWTTTRDE